MKKSKKSRKVASSPNPLALSVAELCLTLRLGRTSALGLIHSGQLGHVRVGDRILVPVREVEMFLERGVQQHRETL